MIIKPKFTGRDKQVLNMIFDDVILPPNLEMKINSIKLELDSDEPLFDAGDIFLIETCISFRELPNYNYRPEDINVIKKEIDRAVTESILNMP